MSGIHARMRQIWILYEAWKLLRFESALERLQLEAPNAFAALLLASITMLIMQSKLTLHSLIFHHWVQICPDMVRKPTKKSVVLALKLSEVL